MTPNQLQSIKTRIAECLAARRISQALDELDSLAAMTNASWHIRERVANLRENYDLMSRYALDGIVDKERSQVRDDIMAGINSVADMILRESKLKESPLLYFSALRYERMQSGNDISSICALYVEKHNRMAMGVMTGNRDIKEPDGRLLAEVIDELGTRLFNLVWTTHPFSSSDSQALLSMIENPTLPAAIKQQMIGAVMLGAMEYFSEQRVLLLGKVYHRQAQGLDVCALCAMLIVMWVQRDLIHTPKIKEMMASLAELPAWQKDVRMAFLQFIRTRDTERINRTMREDVIPSMMKLRPNINKIIKDDADVLDAMSMELNPEWEEMFEKSGLGNKLRELSELQADGADVMMSTFAHLKSFPFFNEVAHWFLPFYVEQYNVQKALDGDSLDLAELLESSPMLCDSDKYSMVFSLERVAGGAKKVMLEQMKAQNINLAEIKNSSLLHEADTRDNSANKYVQDLYRFFTLYRRKGEFKNPFASPVNLVEIPELAAVFDADDTLQLVAQFYFKRGYYAEAFTIYKMLLERLGADAQLYQKAGYCMQQLGDIPKATELYERSEFINPDNLWTQRRLAVCYRLQGMYEKAAGYYERLLDKKPNDLGLSQHLGNCYLELKRYDDALKQYFKVEFLDQKSHRALRPIAWCLLMTGQYDRSREYFDKVIDSDSPSANDYLNFGHLEMAQGHFREAVSKYEESAKLLGYDKMKWRDMYSADRDELVALSVDDFMIDLVADYI